MIPAARNLAVVFLLLLVTCDAALACRARPQPRSVAVEARDALEMNSNEPVALLQMKATLFFVDGTSCGGDSLVEFATVNEVFRGALKAGDSVAIASGSVVLRLEDVGAFGNGGTIARVALIPLDSAEKARVKALFEGNKHLTLNSDAPLYKVLTRPIGAQR